MVIQWPLPTRRLRIRFNRSHADLSQRGHRLPRRNKKAIRTTATLRLQDTVRLSADGLAKVLGDLEARILRAVWAIGRPVTARDVHTRVARAHDVLPVTTITVLNKLVSKRVLARARRDDVFHYSARLDEPAFMAQVSRRVVEGVLSFGPDAVAASFVDVLFEHDPRQLEELGRLIRRRLRSRDER